MVFVGFRQPVVFGQVSFSVAPIDFRLCLLCQGDKFTNIKGDHQVEQLRQPALESYTKQCQQLVDCIQHRAQYQNLSGTSGEELNNVAQIMS